MTLRIASKPSELAVIIGVVELILGETFAFVSEHAAAWRRKNKLYRTGKYRISMRAWRHYPERYFTLFLLSVLLALTIVLELSIDSAFFRSTKRLSPEEGVRCFGPRRPTRYFAGNGPSTGELEDERIPAYVEETDCKDSLLDLSLQGGAALEQGYPSCLDPFEDRDFEVLLGVQGGAIGFVGNSEAGDPHIDYGVEEGGEIVAPDPGENLAGTSFWNLGLWSLGRSTGFWAFTENSERVGSNVALPRGVLLDAPKEFPSESRELVSCTENSLNCYNSLRPKALSASPIFRSYEEKQLGMVVSSLKNLDSSLCIFSSMRLEVEWVYVNMSIPEVERLGRAGPLPVRIRLEGSGKCLPRISQSSGRMYIEAVEFATMNETLNTTEQATFDNLQSFLQVAAVITGIKTLPEQGVSCTPFGVVAGSTVGKTELIVTVLVSGLVLLSLPVLCWRIISLARTCPIRTDPLDPLWPVRILQDVRRRLDSTSGRISGVETDPGSDGGSAGGEGGERGGVGLGTALATGRRSSEDSHAEERSASRGLSGGPGVSQASSQPGVLGWVRGLSRRSDTARGRSRDRGGPDDLWVSMDDVTGPPESNAQP